MLLHAINTPNLTNILLPQLYLTNLCYLPYKPLLYTLQTSVSEATSTLQTSALHLTNLRLLCVKL